jgi:hypothetical protein
MTQFEHPFDLEPIVESDDDGIDLFAEEALDVPSGEIAALACNNTLSTITCDCATTLSTIFCYGCSFGGDGGGGDSDGDGGGGDDGTGGDSGGDPC